MEHEPLEKTTAALTLQIRPERQLLRNDGCEHAIDFSIHVGPAPVRQKPARAPLTLALVLDRSGSMQGEKLQLAKRATLTVLDQLSERDQVAVVVFDNRVDLVQAMAPVTPGLRLQVKTVLQEIAARASTALHQGWLTGCNALVSDIGSSDEQALARCLLLTDGIANVGVTDPEHIASEAAGVREHTGISTSTFGIGSDYNELLLGPLAVAGGGQFYHLRSPKEIVQTFVGELGELLNTGARQVRLEVEIESGLRMELISPYWIDKAASLITIGDLQYDEEQHVILRLHFPARWNSEKRTVRARLVWQGGQSDWQELQFSYASDTACTSETADPLVAHWARLHESDHARREAIVLNKRGDLAGAQAVLQQVATQVAQSAGNDKELLSEVAALQTLGQQMAAAPLPPPAAKEHYYQQQRRSHNKRDHRVTEEE